MKHIQPSRTKHPVKSYLEKLSRLSIRIPIKNKKDRQNRLRRIRRTKKGLEFYRKVLKVSRLDHIKISEGKKIVRGYHKKHGKHKKPKFRLRQGKQFIRETFARRGAGLVLKGAYYRLPKPYGQSFNDAINTENRRNVMRTDGVIVLGDIRAFMLRINYAGRWHSSIIYSIDVNFSKTLAEELKLLEFMRENELDTDEVAELPENLPQPKRNNIMEIGIQFIYAG